ncbi:PTS sugar transporter subunit IIC [Clostridium nigeriense]|uniref:PTS sugar transporter subunit IIC n=1 Tax=Clostridium nigeriense TaxID=1805470 RepID=UPI000B2A9D4C|nr:PTS transporter subunit EIIC [Clostridium nigeriense]
MVAAVGIDAYLWKGVDSSFGLMGIVASFGIANSLARQNKVDGVSAGIIALSSFIVVTPFVSGETGTGIPVGYMGSKGLFVAMILGIISASIFCWFIKRDIQIKLPDSVPPAVARIFSALIPGAAIITLWLVVFAVLDKMNIGNIHDIMMIVLGGPLGLLGNNIFGTIIAIIARRKNASKMTKAMAPLTLTPGIFNINEPAMFGLPIVMNVSLIIPFILAPVANAVISYVAMASGLVARTKGITVSWTMPPILSGFLITGNHISGAILQLVCILVDVAIYWFFYKAVEKQNLALEAVEANEVMN